MSDELKLNVESGDQVDQVLGEADQAIREAGQAIGETAATATASPITLTLTPAQPEGEGAAVAASAAQVAQKPAVKPEEVAPVYTPEERKMIEDFSKKIDVTDTNLVFSYGAGAQQQIASFSDSALKNVQTQDLGEVGDLIGGLVTELRGFTIDDEEKGGIFGFFRKQVDKLQMMKAKFDHAEVNVNKIVDGLEGHQVQLLKDIATLDQLYEQNLTYFKE
ncbi:MAG: toxic anion resistance protein, partial [Clostridia bacterium]